MYVSSFNILRHRANYGLSNVERIVRTVSIFNSLRHRENYGLSTVRRAIWPLDNVSATTVSMSPRFESCLRVDRSIWY